MALHRGRLGTRYWVYWCLSTGVLRARWMFNIVFCPCLSAGHRDTLTRRVGCIEFRLRDDVLCTAVRTRECVFRRSQTKFELCSKDLGGRHIPRLPALRTYNFHWLLLLSYVDTRINGIASAVIWF